MKLKIIVAMCNNRGIGYDNKLPWKFSSDMKYFSKITKGNNNNAIIMGRNTHESIGKLLPNRYNIVLSKSNHNILKQANFFKNIQDVSIFCNEKKFDDVWIIGGESIYRQFLDLNIVDQVYITQIINDYPCDTFFPELKKDFVLTHSFSKSEKDTTLCFKTYTKL